MAGRDMENVEEIEAKIADLKARWPAHSVPPRMWQELERLEDELEEARRAGTMSKAKGEQDGNN